MLQAMVAAGEGGASMPSSLRFIAVGGAPVAPSLLQRAYQLGLPVFEGYGLSECASVVALNAPDCSRLGSVGRALPHVSVSFSADGEILVSGSTFLGYLGHECPPQPWPTGDLGYVDAEGFLHLTGRKKSLFITSFGRNVAPEWVERELTQQPAIAQAALFGECTPLNVVVIVPRPGFSEDEIETAIELVNQSLPDYARASTWLKASAPFTQKNGLLTANGRLKREAILEAYTESIEQLFMKEIHDVF
jgi:long-subunit acyl-CoA synthetase (AMP-forming)